MWLEAVSESSCVEEQCPTCGSGVRRRPYGEMHAGSFVLDGRRVEVRGKPPADFADPIVLDPITQYFDGHLYKVWPKSRYFSRGGNRYIHRMVWAAAFGPVPVGCHIHHRDANRANNAIANLECLPKSEHLSKTGGLRKGRDAFSEWARDSAKAWHGSEAGRLWHSRHARETKPWKKWKRQSIHCAHCGVDFMGVVRPRGRAQKWCSNSCK